MTYEIYQYIFYGSLIMCIIMLVLSIILFFVFKIPKIVGFLTGATARKAIKSINEHTEQSMSQRLKQKKGKLYNEIDFSSSGKLMKKTNVSMDSDSPVTEKFKTASLAPYNETTVLKQRGDETTVLSQMSSLEETSVLNNEAGTENGSEPKEFAVIYDITYIWTDEIIN